MWYETENGDTVRPSDIDETSSHVYVYVRRNIVLIDEEEIGDMIVPAHYRWEEIKIPKNIWSVCQTVFVHDEALDDVYEALTELAELIVGE